MSKKFKAPPGSEDVVKAIKKDQSGKKKKVNPWAVAWAEYNKGKKMSEPLYSGSTRSGETFAEGDDVKKKPDRSGKKKRLKVGKRRKKKKVGKRTRKYDAHKHPRTKGGTFAPKVKKTEEESSIKKKEEQKEKKGDDEKKKSDKKMLGLFAALFFANFMKFRHEFMEMGIAQAFGEDRRERNALSTTKDVFKDIMAQANYQGRKRAPGPTRVSVAALRHMYRERAESLAIDAAEKMNARVVKALNEIKKSGKKMTQLGVREVIDKYVNAYTGTVLRTVINDENEKGFMAQMSHPDVMANTPGLRFVTMRDDRVRHNHSPAEGFVARTSDPVWEELRPPLGFNCRCRLEPVSSEEIKSLRIGHREAPPSGAHRDEGFLAS